MISTRPVVCSIHIFGPSSVPEGASSSWRRRSVIAAGAALLVGGAAAMRKSDRGGPHSAYFGKLSSALKRAGIARPTLVVDRQRLEHNIRVVRATLAPARLPLRVVVKSLPSPALIHLIASGLGTSRLMVFNGAMLRDSALRWPEADLLLGKPLPIVEARRLMTALPPQSIARVQWLIDSPERLREYAEVAKTTGQRLRLNLELDIGLHRGGFAHARAVAAAVQLCQQSSLHPLSGLMGYDPHVPKLLDPESAYVRTQDQYAAAIDAVREVTNLNPDGLTLNGAGSPTYSRHARGTVANEVAVGSAFVKPTDFDTTWLEGHLPAAYIATPVLKAGDRFVMPGLEWASAPLSLHDPNAARAFFIHGGNWLAQPVSPPGLQFSKLYGRSSNQELLTGSDRVRLRPDDHVFFRPSQSEAVFLQFGDIAVYEGGEIVESWPTFPFSA